MRFDRAAGASGAVGIVLLGTALLLPGAPVTTDEPVARVVRALRDHHVAFGLSTYLAGVGLLSMCVFAGALHQALAAAGAGVGATGAAVASVGGPLLIVVGMSVFTGLGLNPALAGGSAVARAGVDTGNVIIELAKFMLTALVVCVVGGPSVSRWMRVTGVLSALALLLSALPPMMVTGGIGQFGGPVDVAGSGPALLWIVALSVVVTRRTRPRAAGCVSASEVAHALP
jgi:hypothetical protein